MQLTRTDVRENMYKLIIIFRKLFKNNCSANVFNGNILIEPPTIALQRDVNINIIKVHRIRIGFFL